MAPLAVIRHKSKGRLQVALGPARFVAITLICRARRRHASLMNATLIRNNLINVTFIRSKGSKNVT
jgi:hypothetical protein